MARQVAILHGWSDNSESFKPLAKFLKQNGFQTVSLFLGDYVSLRDDVKIDDVIKRMEEVVREKQSRPVGANDRLDKSFDLIVHSTGGLVARRWISTHYANKPCPVKNLVMLAPANFGSKLAHIGRTMLGRVAKGWRTGFESGEEMLYALELSSAFQWDLVREDLLIEPGGNAGNAVFYGPDKVRPFVITGTHPYEERAAKLVHENGSDGTVRATAANMNTHGLTIDFSGDPANLLNPKVTPWKRRGGQTNDFPFALLPDRNHGDVIRPDEPGLSKDPQAQQRLGQLILQALRVNSAAQYAKAFDEWKAVTENTRNLAGTKGAAQTARNAFFRKRGTPADYFHEYFQVNVQVEDEFGEAIPDYFLSFMPKQKQNWYSLKKGFSPAGAYFHEEVLENVHEYRPDRSRRALYIDRFDLMCEGGYYSRLKDPAQEKAVYVTLSAADPGDRIAYFTREEALKRGLIRIHQKAEPKGRWLRRNRTHFVKVIVPRAADPGVFKLKRG
jgi:pimeloyl-ACP methyl ester carboxylesterase